MKDKLKDKKAIKKDLKQKQIAIKRIRTKFDIKINQNKMLRNEIENKIQLEKG